MKIQVRVSLYNGGAWAVWRYEPGGAAMHIYATREEAEAHAHALCEEFGYERIE